MKPVRPLASTYTTNESSKITREAELKKPQGDENTSKISDLLGTDPHSLIAHYISCLDKVYKKPFDGLPSKEQREARTKLGAACWVELKSKLKELAADIDLGDLAKVWDSKLHPYDMKRGNNIATPKRDKDDNIINVEYQGRWACAFGDKKVILEPDEEEVKQIAKRITAHLFVHEITITGDKRKLEKSCGFIERRSRSIENSSAPLTYCDETNAWSDDDVVKYFASDIAVSIYEGAKALEERYKRPRANLSGNILYDHFGKVFAPHETRVAAKKAMPGMYALHDTIQEFYRNYLKKTKKGTKSEKGTKRGKVSDGLPRDQDALLRRISNRQQNSEVNRLIRIGRIAHYEKLHAGAPVNDTSYRPGGYFKTSAGQSEIKRNEAFTRIWSSVISLGSRSAWTMSGCEAYAARDDIERFDILGQEERSKFLDSADFDEEKVLPRLQALFGESASRFETLFAGNAANTGPKDIVRVLCQALADCRNQVVHFSGRPQFVEKVQANLSGNLNKHIQNCLKDIYATDHTARFERIKKDLASARFLYTEDNRTNINDKDKDWMGFAPDQDAVDSVYNAIAKANGSDIVLPKFNRFLLKVKDNVGLKVTGVENGSFPAPANTHDLKKDPLRCKYVVLKMLYEGPFREWLEQDDQYDLDKVRQHVIAHADERVKKTMGRNDKTKENKHHALMRSKASKLKIPPKGASLAQYLFMLTEQTASEMQVQKGYDPDPEQAREQAEFIYTHQCEIVAILFERYLAGASMNWLLQLTDKSGPKSALGLKWPEFEADQIGAFDWRATLYAMLHLIPANNVSLLLSQFKKWKRLEAKSTGDDASFQKPSEVAQMREVLELYVYMHNDKFDGGAINIGLDAYKQFYHDDNFERVFPVDQQDDNLLNATRRGMREVMRFGESSLNLLFDGTQQIVFRDVREYNDYVLSTPGNKSKIEEYQTKKRRLHKKAVNNPNGFTIENYDDYKEATNQIGKFRKLAAKIRMSDHLRAHQIMMEVLGRLVDYARTWERDRYFVLLALLEQDKSLTRENAFNCKTAYDKFNKLNQINDEKLDETIQSRFQRYFPPVVQQKTVQGDVLDLALDPVRNDLAHYHVLSKEKISLTLQVNAVRQLVSYDRKLKNAVSTSVKDIFKREGITLKWNSNCVHWLEQPTLNVEELVHFGKMSFREELKRHARNNAIKEPRQSTELLNLLRKIL